MAYELIETIELGSPASSITFSSIPDTFTDIAILFSGRSTKNDNYNRVDLYINGSTSNITNIYLRGTGNATASGSTPAQELALVPANTATGDSFGNTSIRISNYTASQNKSISVDDVMEDNATIAYQNLKAMLWSDTSAITSVGLVSASDSFATGTSASLFGITAEDAGVLAQPKATGGTVSYSGGYWYHTFTASGTLTATEPITAEIIAVGGGGGGGRATGAGGGGGAGGLDFGTQSLSAQAYTVTVGAGGPEQRNNNNSGKNGANGNDSSFGALVTGIGGGGGGGTYGNGPLSQANGQDGGCGGGSGDNGNYGTDYFGGTGSQGFDGGDSNTPNKGAGGGGMGADGSDAFGDSGAGRDGGIGTNAYATWATATNTGDSGYYAGGGGGGCQNFSNPGNGALGGGGRGESNAVGIEAEAGQANTGGGGGGSSNDGSQSLAKSGGSGIVIVRYAA